ncbi:MAG: SDR family oxidoreductase [Rickettsiales bacterium]|jgi:NAD(P)-dependent dehydrogenase (short-subunit alcohol dehydrogenase family)|nr:SDR family oxidoreductase [Rickettsiales bacterium]
MTTAIITGGSKGIGFGIAELFVKKGYNVVICSRADANLLEARRKLGEGVLALKCDVANYGEVQNVFQTAQKHFGRIDILVNSAAIISNALVDDLEISEFDRMLDVNLKGSFYCIKEAFKYMVSGGSIVNMTSLGGISGYEKFPGFSAYSISKYAVSGMSEILAVESKEKNIRINAIALGAVNTDMLAKAAPGLKSKTEARDIAPIIDFLCDKEQSGHMNGSVIPVNTNL